MTSQRLNQSLPSASELYPLLLIDDAPAKLAAERVIQAIQKKPTLTLCLPTGRTIRPVLGHLVDAYKQQRVSFARVHFCNVDEYIGLGREHPSSFAFFLQKGFFDHVDADPSRICLFDGMAGDLDAEMRRFSQWVEAVGGIDFGLFGIGRNGHIGFNEPGNDQHQAVHVVCLSPETLAANRVDLPLQMPPRQAITIGLGAILAMREVLLIAAGDTKAEAVRALFDEGPVSECPARILRDHPNATVIADPAAARDVMAGSGCSPIATLT